VAVVLLPQGGREVLSEEHDAVSGLAVSRATPQMDGVTDACGGSRAAGAVRR
jgi:hypothetical protein